METDWEESAKVGEELAVQRWLRQHNGDLERLKERFGLRGRVHREENLVLLKYQQLSAPFQFAVTRECRGIVLELDTWRVVCYPYEKFFNASEPFAAKAPPLDMKTVRTYEKLDGSLATLYWYNKKWRVSSSGTPDGDGLLTDTETFAEMFWRIWKKEGYAYPKDKKMNYVFEMIARDNTIVVVPKEDELILHGARRLPSLEEVWPEEIAEANGWKCVQSYPLKSFKQIEAACKTLNPHEHEGFVLVDANFRRRKVKSPAYVGLSLLSSRGGNDNERNLLRIVRQNEVDEYLSYYPQWEVMGKYIRERYNEAMEKIWKEFRRPSTESSDLKELFQEMRDEGLGRKGHEQAQMLRIKEWFAEVPIKQAQLFLDMYAPEDMRKRQHMLAREQVVFERMGLDTRHKNSKKKKKKKKKNQPEEAAKQMKVEHQQEQHHEWEVQRSKRGTRKAAQEMHDLDVLIEEFKRDDRYKGKKKGKKGKNRR